MNSAICLAPSCSLAPSYQDRSSRYLADACSPLVEAVRYGQVKFAALARGHYPGHRLDPGVLPGVSSLGHWDAHREQTWGLPWHRNEGIEISYLEGGRLDFSVDADEFTVQPGDIAVTRPWQIHRVGKPNIGPSRLHWLILDVGVRHHDDSWVWPSWLLLSPHELDQIRCELLRRRRLVLRVSADIRHCFQQISHAVERHDAVKDISRLAIRINDLLLCLLELFRAEPAHSDQLWTGSRQSVHLFLSQLAVDRRSLARPWSVESMAARCGLKVTQFVRYVKELTNLPPLHYLNQCRLECASRLLADQPNMRVTDIAMACGFSSSQYFATLFRQRFGATPTQFSTSHTRSSGSPEGSAVITAGPKVVPMSAAAAQEP